MVTVYLISLPLLVLTMTVGATQELGGLLFYFYSVLSEVMAEDYSAMTPLLVLA